MLFHHVILVYIKTLINMNLGKINHPYFGPCRTYILPHSRVIEYRQEKNKLGNWLVEYHKYRSRQWNWCFFPIDVSDSEYESFKIDKNKPTTFKIKYEGFYAVSLAQEIRKRKNRHFNFSATEILYIMGCALKGWREWEAFCIDQSYSTNQFGISSSSILLNEEGDAKLIVKISSPLETPTSQYYAPEYCPPNKQSLESWNKSIAFSIGLIGFEMLSLQIAAQLYETKGEGVIKFNFDEYHKKMQMIQRHSDGFQENEGIEIVINLIKFLTEHNCFIRMKFGQLQAFLNPYMKKILEGESVEMKREECYSSIVKYLREGRETMDQQGK